MIDLFIALLAGVGIGIITGLVPGVHVNMVSVMLVSGAPFLLHYFSPLSIGVFILSLGLIHTFLDAIPSIFLGAPDPDMVLSVLPGHRLLLQGRGCQAVFLTVIGSFFGLLITLVLIPFIIPGLPKLSAWITPWMGYLLLGVVIFMIAIEKEGRKIFMSTYLVILAGVLGLLVFRIPFSQPLFPLLSGLFGVSSLLLSLGENVHLPRQELHAEYTVGKRGVTSLLASVFSGSLTGMLPGVGAAQASILGTFLVGNAGDEAYLVMVGGISTVNFIFSLATLVALEKARNGAIVALMHFLPHVDIRTLIVLMLASLAVGGVSSILAMKFSKVFSSMLSAKNYHAIAIGVIAFVSVLVYFLSGWIGLLVLATSTAVGLLPALYNVKRSHSMACLIVPVIVYFIG